MKLYIIGNGFDNHHHLNTKYSDYSDYLKDNHQGLHSDFESFPGLSISPDGLWTDVENALSLDYWEIMDELMNDYPDLSDDSDSRWHRMGISAELLKNIIARFTGSVFFEWLSNIDYSKVNPDLLFSEDSVFITFNYTMVLENYYGVPSDRILHIHGTIDNYDSIQFGSSDNDPDQCVKEMEARFSDDDFYAVSIEDAVRELGYTLETAHKDQKSNYKSMISFLKSIEVDEIIIMGHAFWGVDNPYYRDIIVPLFSDCKWTVYCHVYSDFCHAARSLEHFDIDNYSLIKW